MTGIATTQWYGVKLSFSSSSSNKFWAMYLSEDGQLLRQWGPSTTSIARGTFASEEHANISAAFSAGRGVLAKKLSDGYTADHAVTRFSVTTHPPDSRGANSSVARTYQVNAGSTAGDSDPVATMRSLISGVAPGTPAATPAGSTSVKSGIPELAHKAQPNYPTRNGTKYFPRFVGGFDGPDNIEDVVMMRTARDHGIHIGLRGAPGCGKTVLTDAAFPDCVTVIGSESTDEAALLGDWNPTDTPGKYVYIDGPAAIAAIEGRTLFVDEGFLIDPEVLSVLYPAMDGRGELYVKGRPAEIGGPIVEVQKGFNVVLAYNPYVPGIRISDAMWSRLGIKIEYTTDFKLCKTMGVPGPAVTAAIKLDKLLRNPGHELMWAPQTRELLRFRDIAAIFGTDFAVANLISECPEEFRDTVEQVVRDVFSSPTVSALVTSARK